MSKVNTIPLKQLKATEEPQMVDFLLTEEEKESLTGVLDLKIYSAAYEIVGASQIYTIDIYLDCDFTVLDNHTFKPVTVPVNDEAELALDTKRDEESDIAIGMDGYYDLRPAFLSLLRSMVPLDYSEKPLKKIETDTFTFMSEDEYQEEQKKSSNPFKDL